MPGWAAVTPVNIAHGSVSRDSSFTDTFTFHFHPVDTGTFPIKIILTPRYVGKDSAAYRCNLVVF
jgi:hypothetical protein